jgi:cytochrome c biogenesis protein
MQKFLKEIQGVFLSLKTTISLLTTIALVSIIGTFIPQQKEAGKYVEHYGETLYRLFDFFGFLNLFGSWWFQLLLVLLMVNLVTCSLSRLPKIWSARGLTKKEWLGRLGPHLTHSSLIVILAGSLIGNIWGFKAYINIPEGESINAVVLRESNQMLNLDFDIRLDKFTEVKYPGSQITKEDASEVTILEKGREVLKKAIRINHPLQFKGVSFYQSGHGFIPPLPGEGKAELEIIPKGNASRGYRLQIGEGETKQIPGTEHRVQFAAFIPDFGVGEGNRPISRSDQLNNPAAQVNIYQNEKLSYKGWSFLRYPDFHGSKDVTYRVKFIDYLGGRPYTGLQVVKDPGVWVVWTGFGMLVLGLVFSFHFRRRPSSDKKLKEKGEKND